MPPGAWTALVVGVTAMFYMVTAARIESFGSDTSTYFGLAESLRLQHAYRFDFEPHTIYPPGYPLLLAGLMSIVGDQFATLVKASIPLYFLGLVAVYWLLKVRRGVVVAAALTILAGVSGDAYFWTTVGLHSDVPYFAVSMLALLCIDIGERTSKRSTRVGLAILAAIAASSLVMLRSIGITFVIGVALWIVFPFIARRAGPLGESLGRLRRWWPVAILPVIVMLLWSSWARQHAPLRSGDYMDSYSSQLFKADPHQIDSPVVSLADLPLRSLRMTGTRGANAFRMVLNAPSIYLNWYSPLVIVFLLMGALGFVRALRREGTVVDLYVLSYGGMLVLYPFDEGSRYLLPLLPFIAMYELDGLRLLSGVGKRIGSVTRNAHLAILGSDRLLAGGQTALFAVVLVAGVVKIADLARVNIHPDPAAFTNAATVNASDWVSRHTSAADRIMNDEYAILHRLTSRKTLRFPLTTNASAIAGHIVDDSIAFVVVLNEKPVEYYNPSAMRRFEAVKQQHPAWFTPVHVFREGIIYRVHREELPGMTSSNRAAQPGTYLSEGLVRADRRANGGSKQQ